MIFVGNHGDWIKPEWVEYILSHDGKEMPRWEFEKNGILEAVARGERAEFCEYQKQYEKAGYKYDSLLYYIYENDDLPFDIGLPPFANLQQGQGYYYNLFKYKPGQVLPIHSDNNTDWEKNCRRYWMPWLDYTEGHVFIYESQLMTGYKAGDVYQFPNAFGVHSACNLSMTPRILYQLTIFDIKHD